MASFSPSGCKSRWRGRSRGAGIASSRSTCSATGAPTVHATWAATRCRSSLCKCSDCSITSRLDEAVVGGTSLGANATLELASLAPKRVRGMVIEMPVLDNALMACALFFTPLMVALTFGETLMRGLATGARMVPSRALPLWSDILLDVVRQEPGPSSAVLHGLFFGRTAPHRDERRTFTQPTLIIGHHRDPVHPFSDAGMLADELPNARLLEADSLMELRTSPERLTGAIAEFVEECWAVRRVRAGGRGRGRSWSRERRGIGERGGPFPQG